MKIDILCTDDGGSTMKVTMNSVWGRDGRIGVGGSELALLTLCEGWQKRGYSVRLYNNPIEQNVSEFQQLPIAAFNPKDDRDVLIVHRVPSPLALVSNGKRIFLSFDQYTSHPFLPFINHVDMVIGISEYHSNYYKNKYGFNDMTVIDLPVRTDDFLFEDKKDEKSLIFTSVPDRGLMNLHAVWPSIRGECPDASLSITSDYRLWGVNRPNNEQFFIHWLGVPNVKFYGALSRIDYLKRLCKSDLLVYPHKSENAELFCISVAEAQFAGVYTITSDAGALKTTNMGTLIGGDAEDMRWRKNFVDEVVRLLNDDNLQKKQKDISKMAYDRFNVNNILDQWENKVFI